MSRQDRRIARARAADKEAARIVAEAVADVRGRRFARGSTAAHTDPTHYREHGACRTPCDECDRRA